MLMSSVFCPASCVVILSGSSVFVCVVGQKSSRGVSGPAAEGTQFRTDQLRLSGPAGQMSTDIS